MRPSRLDGTLNDTEKINWSDLHVDRYKTLSIHLWIKYNYITKCDHMDVLMKNIYVSLMLVRMFLYFISLIRTTSNKSAELFLSLRMHVRKIHKKTHTNNYLILISPRVVRIVVATTLIDSPAQETRILRPSTGGYVSVRKPSRGQNPKHIR